VATRSSQPGRPARRLAPGSAPGAAHGGAPRPRRRESENRDGPSPGTEFIYGRNPVREALRGRRRVHAVLVAMGEGGEGLERSLQDWCADASCAVPAVQRLPAGELSSRLRTGDHQGIAAEVDPYPYLDLEVVLRDHTLLVALDEIQDPHNLGAVIRTAEETGAGVLIPRHRAAEVTAAVVKASAGASEHAAVVRVRNLADSLVQAKEAGFWIYGAASGADSLYTSQDYEYPTCFVVGSEGEGLGRRVASLCDVMVGLPLAGRVGSLNVSVSTGVLLYEALRQRGAQAAARTATQGAAPGATRPPGPGAASPDDA